MFATSAITSTLSVHTVARSWQSAAIPAVSYPLPHSISGRQPISVPGRKRATLNRIVGYLQQGADSNTIARCVAFSLPGTLPFRGYAGRMEAGPGSLVWSGGAPPIESSSAHPFV